MLFRSQRNVLHKIAKVLKQKVDDRDPVGIANILYSAFKDKFEHLSKDQYVSLAQEFYKTEKEAREEGRTRADFNPGNWGWSSSGNVNKISKFDV